MKIMLLVICKSREVWKWGIEKPLWKDMIGLIIFLESPPSKGFQAFLIVGSAATVK